MPCLTLDHSARHINVKDIEASDLAPQEWLRKRVLLSDIDDSLVLDLQHHRAARANGLLLKEEKPYQLHPLSFDPLQGLELISARRPFRGPSRFID